MAKYRLSPIWLEFDSFESRIGVFGNLRTDAGEQLAFLNYAYRCFFLRKYEDLLALFPSGRECPECYEFLEQRHREFRGETFIAFFVEQIKGLDHPHRTWRVILDVVLLRR